MQNNPILTAFKIAAFGILAFLVWITFWQGLRREDDTKELMKRMSQLQADVAASQARSREFIDAVNGLAGQVEALKDVAAAGGFAGGGATGRSTARPTAPPAAGDAPAWLSDEARALWGRHENYLTPDPEALAMPRLDDPEVDPAGRYACWYGSTPSGINVLTTSDARLTENIEAYAHAQPADRHARDPYAWTGDLAIRVEVNKPDHTEWVVWLRNDAYWHKPQVDLERYPHLKGRHPVTAHDFKFTLDLILDPSVDAAHLRNYYSECEGIEVVDDYCYIVRWRKPQYNSISFTLAMQPAPEFVFAYDETGRRYDEGQMGLAFNDHWFYKNNLWIGCGAYYVAEYDPSSHWLLRRNDEYHGEIPVIREIYFDIFPDRETQVRKIRTGEHDGGSIDAKNWERNVVQGDPGSPFVDGSIAEHWVWRTSYSFIAWQNKHAIFSDPRVRTAMTLACDRYRIRDVLELGKAKLSTGPHLPTTPFSPPDLEPLPFDLERAAAVLAEAGWADRDGDGVLEKEIEGTVTPFSFSAMVPNNQLFKPIFEIFKEDLSKIGVRMDIELLEWKQFAARLDSRTFECTALLWSSDGWESDLYQIWHSSQIDEVPSSNFIQFGDEEVDRLIVDLRSTFDPDERIRMQRQAHWRIAELQPYTFLMTYELPYMYWQDRVGNVEEAAKFIIRPKLRLSGLSIRRGE